MITPARGINYCGAEFGTAMPGIVNTDYIYPDESSVRYLAGRGITLFRLPFRAERGLDSGRLADAVALLRSFDIAVSLDMHNYSRITRGGQEHLLGSTWAVEDYVQSWLTIANDPAIKNHKDVSFDVMNEPHDLPDTESMSAVEIWEDASQQVVTALRSAGITNKIKVESYGWSGAQSVADYHDAWWINDPLNNSVLSCHYYLDENHTGTYHNSDGSIKTYAENDQAIQAGGRYTSTLDMIEKELQRFTDWVEAQSTLPEIEIGEIGWPATATVSEWNAAGRAAYERISAIEKRSTIIYWATGPWWWSYPLAAYNGNPVSNTRAQAALIETL